MMFLLKTEYLERSAELGADDAIFARFDIILYVCRGNKSIQIFRNRLFTFISTRAAALITTALTSFKRSAASNDNLHALTG